MRPIKLKVKTKSENYPIIIGSNVVCNLKSFLNKNSILFNKCLLVIDKNVPTKLVAQIIQPHVYSCMNITKHQTPF